jgi:translation initiation factor 1
MKVADRIVYSTDPDWKPESEKKSEKILKSDQLAYIERERKGHGGKTVTTISNLRGDLKLLLKDLRIFCGSGGTLKNGIIQIQGDQRNKIAEYLDQNGIRYKKRGG